MTTEHTVAGEDDHDQLSLRAAEPALPAATEERRWRYLSAVHAARALNARPA